MSESQYSSSSTSSNKYALGVSSTYQTPSYGQSTSYKASEITGGLSGSGVR